jgi:putative intracellular protease/amidase
MKTSLVPFGLIALATAAPAAAAPDARKNVAIVLYQGVELLDFAGPGEVFASQRGAFHVYTVAETAAPVRSQGFLTIVPEYSIANAPAPDIVVIPGGNAKSVTDSPAMMAWVKGAIAHDELTMSVCTGAFVLARAGALAGKKATSHWSALAALREAEPTATVLDDVRFVDNGRIVTTAGVSAGIDGSLHVIERLLGEEAAWATARYMQYAWEPPPGAVAGDAREAMRAWIMQDWPDAEAAYRRVADRDHRDGRAQLRLAAAAYYQGKLDAADAAAARAHELGVRDPDELEVLAAAQITAKRYRDAARTYELAAGATPARAVDHYNAACAHALAGQRDQAFGQLEQAVAGGFRDRAQMERDSDLASLRSDPRYKKLLERL